MVEVETVNWGQKLYEILFKTLFTQVLLIEILTARNHVRNFEKLKAFSLKLKTGKQEEMIDSFFVARIPKSIDFKFEILWLIVGLKIKNFDGTSKIL